jgi:hypothetical protein
VVHYIRFCQRYQHQRDRHIECVPYPTWLAAAACTTVVHTVWWVVAAVVITHNVSLVAQAVLLSACKQQQIAQAHVLSLRSSAVWMPCSMQGQASSLLS